MSRPEDAEQTCHALNDSGQVLLYQNKAYLRPAEVAEMVLQALPDTTKDLEDKLTILQRELQPLEDTKRDVDKRAHMCACKPVLCPFAHMSCMVGGNLHSVVLALAAEAGCTIQAHLNLP